MKKKKAEDYLVKLDESDRKILSSYCTLCDCLGAYLGNAYEIVVHSLGIGDNFVRKFVNSKSGRSVKDHEDISFVLAIEQLYARILNGDLPVIVYFGSGKTGEDMYKSTSIGIVGSENRLIGMLCINFQLNAPFMDIINSLALPNNLIAGHLFLNDQNDNHGYEATLYETIQNTKDLVMDNPEIPAKYKRKEIIRRLNEAGVFEIKNGVAICAEILGVTITTIYMHLRNIDESNNSG